MDHQQRPNGFAGLDSAQRHHIVGTDHQHGLHPLDFLNGPLGYQDRVLGSLDGRAHAAELPWAQQRTRVRKLGDGCQSAGLDVDSPIDDE